MNTAQEQGDYLITMHGLARTWRSMKKPLEYFTRQGYTTRSFSYPSTRYDLDTLARRYFAPFIEQWCQGRNRKIHILTHSMGGILVRYYLKEQHPENLGRVVMLAPPNQGSDIVDIEKRWFIWHPSSAPVGLANPTGMTVWICQSTPSMKDAVHVQKDFRAGRPATRH